MLSTAMSRGSTWNLRRAEMRGLINWNLRRAEMRGLINWNLRRAEMRGLINWNLRRAEMRGLINWNLRRAEMRGLIQAKVAAPPGMRPSSSRIFAWRGTEEGDRVGQLTSLTNEKRGGEVAAQSRMTLRPGTLWK